MSEQLLVRLTKQNRSREMYSPMRGNTRKQKYTSAFDKHCLLVQEFKRSCTIFVVLVVFRRIDEYISLDLFYFDIRRLCHGIMARAYDLVILHAEPGTDHIINTFHVNRNHNTGTGPRSSMHEKLAGLWRSGAGESRNLLL